MFFTGSQYARDEKISFGLFTDSSPDRWGRMLMQRRETYNARQEGRAPTKLFESDYLLGVSDYTRMGGLRFKLDPDADFMDNNADRPAPPIQTLRSLEAASYAIEENDAENNPHFGEWLRLLIAPGSSLGGARPKGSVVDENGSLWIAKFPSRNDTYDVGSWEAVVTELARKAGICVAHGRPEKYTSRYSTYLTKRFDRRSNGDRIHFASAMTMLGLTDGADASQGISYLDIAECIMRVGATPTEDMKELWARMVFNICVSNTDDHLRNHGFLLDKRGWSLSPAYDLNPVPGATHLTLNISENDSTLDIGLALEVAESFRLGRKEAQTLLQEITSTVKDWRTEAEKAGIPRSEISFMESAFAIDARR